VTLINKAYTKLFFEIKKKTQLSPRGLQPTAPRYTALKLDTAVWQLATKSVLM